MPMYEKQSDGSLLLLKGPFQLMPDLTLSEQLVFSRYTPPVYPAPPAITDLTMPSRTSAVVEWAPSTPPVAGVVVLNYEVRRNGAVVATTKGNVLTYTQTSLPVATPEVVHTYSVTAIGQFGPGAASQSVQVQWNAAPPPAVPTAPTSFRQTDATTTSMTFAWAAAADASVTKQTIKRAGGTVVRDDLPPDIRTLVVSGLTNPTTYNSVWATRTNPVGESAASNTIAASTDNQGTGPLLPGQIAGKSIVGMATDNYAQRVAETGPVGAEHSFVGSWTPSQTVQKARDIHALGLLPVLGMKVDGGTGGLPLTTSWGRVANGELDDSCAAMAEDLAALDYPIRLAFHHEPGSNEGGTLTQWAAMQVRLFRIIKPIAPKVVLGPLDNGFKWSDTNQGYTDMQLSYYSDDLLDEMMVHGADYYDGAKSRTTGERAQIKAENAAAWADRIGFTKPMDSGEWQFVRPSDCAAMWSFVKADPARWWLMVAFNSDVNNRANIPTIGAGWNYTHGYDTANDRLNAFKDMLADPISYP